MWELSEPAAGLLLFGAVAGPFALVPLLLALRGNELPWLLATSWMIAEAAIFLLLWNQQEAVVVSIPWIPSLGVILTLRLDALAWSYCQIVSLVGATIFFFSMGYVPGDLSKRGSGRRASSLAALLMAFAGSMLGMVLSDNLFALYVYWEMTTISSFLLISFHSHEKMSRSAGLHALVVTGGTSLFLLVALISLSLVGGSPSLSELSALPTGWLAFSPFAPVVASGVMISAMAKSAQIPFHGWLPDAMVAPTPVSAFLHSAAMVASGVFLLARLAPILSPIPGHDQVLVWIGFASLLGGGMVALAKSDLKAILAWSTISQYGYVVVLIGLGSLEAALFFIVFHAVAKSGLFLATGALQAATGKSDLREVGGLWKIHPKIASLTLLLAFSLAGFPPLAGFWMKEAFFEEAFEAFGALGVIATVLGSSLTVAYLVRFGWSVSFGPTKGIEEGAFQRWPLLLPPAVLATLLLLGGLFPSSGGRAAVQPPLITLELGFSWPPSAAFFGSALSLSLGVGFVAWLQRSASRGDNTPAAILGEAIAAYGPANLFTWFSTSLGGLSKLLVRLQTGRLFHYLAALLLVFVTLGTALLFGSKVPWQLPSSTLEGIDSETIAFLVMAVTATGLAIASTFVRSHVASILMVGGVGYAIALIFVLLRAPDIALVQMVVETATALLLIAAVGRFPEETRRRILQPKGDRAPGLRAFSWVLAGLTGSTVFNFLHDLGFAPRDPTLGRAYLDLAAATDNPSVVKAILADFRAIDTLGETAVFGAAALGSVLLLGSRRERKPVS